MAKALLNAFFSFFVGTFSPILGWITSALLNLIPDSTFNSIFIPLSNFLDYLKQFAPFCLSYLGLSSNVLSIITIMVIAIISIPILVHGVKLALRWYRILMP